MYISNRTMRHVALIRRSGYLLFFWLTLSLAQAGTTTILVVGDSLSAGYGFRQEEAWPALLQKRLNSTPLTKHEQSYRVVNASISGETTAGGRNRLPKLLNQHQPTLVIFELGANDGLRGLQLAAMKHNLLEMLTQAKNKGARTLLVGMRLPPNYGAYAVEFQKTFADIATRAGTPLVPFLLENLDQAPEHFQPDGLHPTREAQHILLSNIWPTLKRILP